MYEQEKGYGIQQSTKARKAVPEEALLSIYLCPSPRTRGNEVDQEGRLDREKTLFSAMTRVAVPIRPLRFQIEVISDTLCPYCYIGKRKLDQAIDIYLERYPEAEFNVVWKPFYLNPGMRRTGM
jgi:hypothetical protein